MAITVSENQHCSAQINGEYCEGIKSFSPPTEQEPHWKIYFDGRIVFATGVVIIDLRDKVEIKVITRK